MKTDLYIPKTITIGFQKRDGTFTGKLGYVIYTDHTGKLRKEASWNSWRDSRIEPITIENTPQTGFTLNKGVQRDRYWGSGRSVVRVWDPRDFEFEISIDNLMGILMHADVSKRDITQACIFAWNGTELILLPTNSVEYEESVKHTEKMIKPFSAKELTVGHTYVLKRDKTEVVYLGRFPRYNIVEVHHDLASSSRYSYSNPLTGHKHEKKKGNAHVFMDPKTKNVFVKDPSTFIGGVVSEEVHADYATLMDLYYNSAESQDVTGVALLPNGAVYSHYKTWIDVGSGVFAEFDRYGHDDNNRYRFSRIARFDPATKQVEFSHERVDSSYYTRGAPAKWLDNVPVTREQMVLLASSINRWWADQSATLPDRRADWTAHSQAQAKLEDTLREQFKFASLHFVLADGRISTDHYL